MPGIPKLSLVEGQFEELALELATYIDTLKGESSTIAADITPLLANPEIEGRPKETDKDAVLKKIVKVSSILNTTPEKELQAAYNLLIHIIAQSDEPGIYLPLVCKGLCQPIAGSPHHGPGLALGILGTLFNAMPADDEMESRYHIFLAITEVVSNTNNYDSLQPQLRNIENWIQDWELEPEDARRVYLAICNVAAKANEPEDSYSYLLKALQTLQDDASSPQARELSLRALKSALLNEKHFDFQDLTALDSIQALRKTDQVWSDLLEHFSADDYEDFQDFKESNPTFLSDNGLNEDVLDRKMRLLTLASQATHASQTRTLPYGAIAKALNIPLADVETWVIDSIRSGLVEGKLSQQRQEFLIHRSTYRVFGDSQWREVASRLETWKSSLQNVLAVIKSQKEEFAREKEAEMNGAAFSDGRQGGYRQDRRQRGPPQAIEAD